MTTKFVTLDVREAFRAGQHPCDKIKGALNRVSEGESLRLLVPFEPVPLFQMADQIGLTHRATPKPSGDWEVLFTRNPKTCDGSSPGKRTTVACGCSHRASESVEIMDVDARGLQPPLPMVRILEALEELPEDTTLTARTDRRPMHLFSFLEDRGFAGESEEQADGSFITHIRRS